MKLLVEFTNIENKEDLSNFKRMETYLRKMGFELSARDVETETSKINHVWELSIDSPNKKINAYVLQKSVIKSKDLENAKKNIKKLNNLSNEEIMQAYKNFIESVKNNPSLKEKYSEEFSNNDKLDKNWHFTEDDEDDDMAGYIEDENGECNCDECRCQREDQENDYGPKKFTEEDVLNAKILRDEIDQKNKVKKFIEELLILDEMDDDPEIKQQIILERLKSFIGIEILSKAIDDSLCKMGR